jgi:hypothetical protein
LGNDWPLTPSPWNGFAAPMVAPEDRCPSFGQHYHSSSQRRAPAHTIDAAPERARSRRTSAESDTARLRRPESLPAAEPAIEANAEAPAPNGHYTARFLAGETYVDAAKPGVARGSHTDREVADRTRTRCSRQSDSPHHRTRYDS